MPDHRISVAPMMDWTDRHCRYFHRLISPNVHLYTEMITSSALINGDRDYLLRHDRAEYPLAIQLGGNSPVDLARCAHWAEQSGYDEVNLNVGCPSDRVKSGQFGACLMLTPEIVAECVVAMTEVVDIPTTVKTRIGVDDQDSYEELVRFVSMLAEAGLQHLIIHARKAWLSGLSPKQNREVPPLCYDRVYQIKKDFPELTVDINGGVKTLPEIEEHLQHVDGVMLGREAYHNPYVLAEIDKKCLQDDLLVRTRHQVVEDLLPYVDEHLHAGGHLQNITRHILGLFHGQPGARRWRRHLSENAHLEGAGIAVITDALGCVE